MSAPAGQLSLLQPSPAGKLREVEDAGVVPQDGCLGAEPGEAVRKSLSHGRSVSLSTGKLFSSSLMPADKYKHFGP